jgi:hypothetical protein
VHAGGKVDGQTALAQALRDDLLTLRAGYAVRVWVGAPPGTSTSLDLKDEAHVDAWVRTHAARQRVEVLSGPEVATSADEIEDDAGDDAIY